MLGKLSREEEWPALPLAPWADVCGTLHMWTQIVGKVRLRASAPINHCWNATLYVTARGLTTSPMAHASGRTFQIDFDFIDHALIVEAAGGGRGEIAKIPLGYEFAYGVAVSPDGARAYVVLSDSPAYAVVVVDITTNSVVTSVPLPGEPSGFSVSLSPDGRFAYFPRIGSGGAGSVQVLDTVTNTIVATTTVGRGPRHVGVSPNGAIVYVPGPQSDQLHQLDPSSHASVGSTAITTPLAVAFTPDSTRAYVAADETLVVMDTATRAVVATIPTIVSRSGFQVGYSRKRSWPHRLPPVSRAQRPRTFAQPPSPVIV